MSAAHTTTTPNPRLALFAKIVVALILLVIFRGAMVTTAGVGMAVPDWPLSFGAWNPPGWWQDFGVRLEHSHRLFGQLLGLLTITLCIWVYRDPGSQSHRRLAATLLGMVILQGVLGGLRVTENNDHPSLALAFRIIHGCIAQATLIVAVTLATRLSPRWIHWPTAFFALPRKLAWITVGVIYTQLIFGAAMRHTGAGLAIPTFPAANPNGGLMPAVHGPYTDINFTHTRVGSVAITVLLIVLAIRVARAAHGEPRLLRPAWSLVGLVLVQFTLGVLVIWHTKPQTLTNIHVLNGALILATTTLLALRLTRAAKAPLPVN